MVAFLKTKFAVAVLVFLLAGVVVAQSKVIRITPDNFPFLSWTGWTIKDFLALENPPDIVFLGSSLVLVPLDGVDADFLRRRIDGSQHHHSCYFESKFKEATGIDVKSFTFALPGEMPSDAFLIVNNLLKGAKKPKVVVYGVGPRDFLDNLLPSPSSTDPFHFLSRFGELEPIASRVMPDWTERLSYELGKWSFFYGQRERLACDLAAGFAQLTDKVVPLPKNSHVISADDRRLLAPEYRPCEVGPGQALFRPSTPKDWAAFSNDNIAEYRKRYAKLKWDTYLTQMEFFADTLEVARCQGVKVVVVMMPVTDINRQLLSDSNWNVYRKGVLAMAKRKGASILDLSETDYFARSDFMDTVHLHSLGGRKWLDLLVDGLSLNQRILSAFEADQSKVNSSLAERGGTQL